MTKTPAPKKSAAVAAPAHQVKAPPAPRKTPVGTKKAPRGAAPAPAPVVVPKPKHKLVRDSFTIPKSEYVVLEALKLRAARLARPTKKSELLRAGIAALNAMSDKAYLAAIGAIPSIKTGRPKGSPKSAA